jgi:hypothetical protein
VSLTLHPAHRKALRLAVRKGGTLVSAPQLQPDGKRKLPKGTVSALVALRLVDAGWATRYGDTLIATTAGKRRLGDPLPPKPAVYLHKRDGLTTRRDLAVHDDEPEVMEAPVHPDWRNHAEAHRKLSRADLDAARLSGLDHPEERLRELRLMAAERGVSISSELRLVERGISSLERKLRREAA